MSCILFPALGFGRGQTTAGPCRGNDQSLRRKKHESFEIPHTQSLIKTLVLSPTVLQSKEEILLLKQLLNGIQAHINGVHVNQRLQNIGAQPSGSTCCFGVVEYA